LFEERQIEEEDESDSQPPTNGSESSQAVNKIKTVDMHTLSATPLQPTVSGAGLKRPLEVDDDGNPIIKKRQRIKMTPKIRGWTVSTPTPIQEEADESEDEDTDESDGNEDDDEEDRIEQESEEES